MIVVKRADNIESPDALIARLVQEYQVPLRRMCCIWLKDAALAEDAVQETFVKAWRAALSFRGECSEKTWLMRIAVHVCWDMRRSWWFRHMDRSVRLEHLPEPAVPFEERDDTLVRAVCALPAQQREAVQGLSTLDGENRALELALTHWQEIGREGVVLRCPDQILGFSLGAPLTETIFDVHFERDGGLAPFLSVGRDARVQGHAINP